MARSHSELMIHSLRAGARDFIGQTASPKELNKLIVRFHGTDDPDMGRLCHRPIQAARWFASADGINRCAKTESA